MDVAVLGPGKIGGNIARLLAAAGHHVTVSLSRDPDALRMFAQEIGARAAAPRDAVAGADVFVLSVPWDATPAALEAAGPLDGRIVIDTTNQFGSGAKPAEGETAAASTLRACRARGTRSRSTP